ncbi:MAG: DUF2807 domain-containing protein [Alistipes sp.]|nr:DUF2807 domain-containing protein [Alistipes sp.]
MKKMSVLIAALAAMLVNTGCLENIVGKPKPGFRGSGDIETHNLGAFEYEGVRAERMVKVIVTDGDSPDVILRADDNILEYVDIKVRDGILIASLDSGLKKVEKCTVEVFVPWHDGLRSLEARSAGRIESQAVIRADEVCIDASAASKIEAEVVARRCDVRATAASSVELEFSDGRLDAKAAGASKLTAEVEAASVDMTAAGASKIELKGAAVEAVLCAAGASKIAASELRTVDCTVSAAGASKVSADCSGALDVSASGASKIEYSGDCRIDGWHCSGASKISCE